jgi:2-polyprenyl-3-methyl-5-hydroxy-6-metoxy-1,4-benzoquinol methylase
MVDLFSEKAKSWDKDDFKTRMSRAISTTMLSHIDFNADMDVMDFGAGTGLISGHLAPKVAHISAVDVSQAMLDRLAAKPELQGKVETLCHDIMEIPLQRKFDVIVSAMAMHHVDDTDKLIENFAAHLKEGGQVALADLDKEDGTFHPPGTEGVYHAGFERQELQQKLNKHGINDVQFVTAYTVEHSGKVFPIFLVLGKKHAIAA